MEELEEVILKNIARDWTKEEISPESKMDLKSLLGNPPNP